MHCYNPEQAATMSEILFQRRLIHIFLCLVLETVKTAGVGGYPMKCRPYCGTVFI